MKKYLVNFLTVLAAIAVILIIPCSRVEAAEGAEPCLRQSKSVYVGKEFQLTLKHVKDTENIVWSVTDTKNATVENGYVIAKKPGNVTVTAEYNGTAYNCEVEIKKPVLNYESKTLDVGDRLKLKLKGGNIKNYVISNKSVARITQKGNVRALAAGRTAVVVIDEYGHPFTCIIEVEDKQRSVTTNVERTDDHLIAVNMKASDVSDTDFEINPGTLINFTNLLMTKGEPSDIVYLKNAEGLTKHISYNSGTRLSRKVIEPLSEMIDAAYAAGGKWFEITKEGGYRTYETQNGYWQQHMREDPKYGDNPYKKGVKAVPGVSSEHRTGYAVDINTTDAMYKWLKENSYKYGFILRYTGEKTKYTGVMDEYWHFTYVGKAVAEVCFRENLCLEEYYDKYVFTEE